MPLSSAKRCEVKLAALNPFCENHEFNIPEDTWFLDENYGGTAGPTTLSACKARADSWAGHATRATASLVVF